MIFNYLIFILILTLASVLVASLYPSIFKYYIYNRKLLFILVFFIGVLVLSAFYVAVSAINSGPNIYSEIFLSIKSYYFLKKNAILFKIGLFCTWLSISIFLYLKVLPKYPKLKKYLDDLGFLKSTLYCFSVLFPIKLVLGFIGDLILLPDINIDKVSMALAPDDSSSENSNSNSNNSNNSTSKTGYTSSNKSSTNTSNTNSLSSIQPSLTDNKLNEVAMDTLLMGSAISAGAKVAQTIPGTAGKVGVLAGSVGFSAAAIIGRNVASKVNSNKGTLLQLKFIEDLINEYFNLTGNPGIDFILLIQFLEKIDLYLIFLICYNLLLLVIGVEKLEQLLSKILPLILVKYFIRITKLLIASIKINVTLLFILLIISHFLSYSYLNFYLENIHYIFETYFK